MLVLSRKVGESIQIAGDIRVTVTEVRGGRVRLSIDAPPSIRVLRKEISDAQASEAVDSAPTFPETNPNQ
jgi:carbon storage regulator